MDPGRIRVVDPDRPASSRPRLALIRANPTGPHPDNPTGPHQGSRPRLTLIRSTRPARIRINRPGRIRGNSSKLRHIQVNSGQTQAKPADKGKHKQLQHIHANTGKQRRTQQIKANTSSSSIFTQTKANKGKQRQIQAAPAYSRKQRQTKANKGKFKQLQHIHANTGKLTQNSSIFKHEEGKETFENHIRLSAGGASGAQPYVGAALQGCAGGVDSAHAQAQHRICR